MFACLFLLRVPGILFLRTQKYYFRCWFKGDDTRTLSAYLQYKLDLVMGGLVEDARPFFSRVLSLFRNANRFLSLLYNCDLWLRDGQRNDIIRFGASFLADFEACAQKAFELRMTRFKLQPKFHMVGEIIFALRLHRSKGIPSLNPLTASTQVDEDFIGRIAVMSRSVSSRTLHHRTLRKYLLFLGTLW